MDIFEKIEEYEKKISSAINDRLAMYLKIVEDLEFYFKMEKDLEKEVPLDKTIKGFISEIKESPCLTRKVIENGKNLKIFNKKRKAKKDSQHDRTNSINPRCEDFMHGTISNAQSSEYVDYFNQASIESSCKKFFKKKTEVELITECVMKALSSDISKKLFVQLNERENSIGKEKRKAEIRIIKNYSERSNPNAIVEESRAHQCSSNQSLVKEESQNRNTQNQSRIPLVKRLYPKPEPKQEILTENFVHSKMLQFRFNGELCKKVNIEDIIKDYKISEKRTEMYTPDLGANIEETARLMKKYQQTKALSKPTLGKLKERRINTDNNNNMCNVGEIEHQINGNKLLGDILIHTNSKLYLKVNRNRKDLIVVNANKEEEKNKTAPHKARIVSSKIKIKGNK